MLSPDLRNRPRRGLRRTKSPSAPKRNRRRLGLERLEDRTLLASATLDINNVVTSPTLGRLTFTGATGAPSNLSIKTASTLLDPTNNTIQVSYTITDTLETIKLTAAATADGWTGSGTNTVTGPASTTQGPSSTTISSIVKSLAINLSSGNDTVSISNATGATTLAFKNNPGDLDTVSLNAKGLSGNVTLTNSAGSTALSVSDASDTTARTVFLSNGELSNISSGLILFGGANLSALSITGANALGTLNVNANDQGPVTVTGGAATGSGTIQIGTNYPINYASFLAVNVSNAADSPLTQVSQSVSTSTGDVATEGKTFTYVTTTFVDADAQAKAANFVATVNWGDGTPASAATVSADGAGHFQVNGSHTYKHAGSFPVVTTVTDSGTTDALSLSGIAVSISDLGGGGLTTGSVAQVNLVQNAPSLPGPIADPKLVNPWGIAGDANGFAWTADEGTGVATYEGPGGSTPEGTAVTIPPASGAGTGSPAGIVFNSTTSFAIGGLPSVFLYATLDGTISGWDGQLATPTAAIALNNAATGAIYTGLAIASNAGQSLLYATNFHTGQVEVYNKLFSLVNTFTDTTLPAGYAPYNVQNIGGSLYVAFARQDPTQKFAVPGLGNGFVDIFTPAGVLTQRLISAAPLNEPWGMAVAPTTFGQFAGDLLVANQGNGQVDAFNPATGQFLGAFSDTTGAAVSNSNLHGLFFGPTGTLYFTAGPNSGANGVFGSLTPTPQPVIVAPATLAETVSNITAFVNQPFNGTIGTFTDANIYALPSDFTATVQWGDGTTDSSTGPNVTITQTDGPGSAFLITGTHIYASSTTGNPPEILKITVAENVGGNSVSSQGTASVSSPTLHAAFSAFTAIVGVPYPGTVATFTDDAPDPNVKDYTAIIHWGDGTQTNGAITLANSAGQGYIVTDAGAHVYPASTVGRNPYVVSVTITKNGKDSLGAPLVESSTAMGNVAVSFPTLHVTFSAFPSVAGSAYNGQVATFTDDSPPPGLQNTGADPNNFYTATITWGDGSASAGTIVQSTTAAGAFSVIASHAYQAPTVGMPPEVGSVTVVKILTNEAALAIGNVPVADALLAPFNQGNVLSVTEGVPFNGVVAQFVSANPFYTAANFNGSFAPLINWGDGKTSLGSVVLNGGIFSVIGAHTYASPTPVGLANTISVAVTDLGGSKTTVTNNVVVNSAPLAFGNLSLPANPAVPIVAGKAFTSDVVWFVSANPAAVAGEFSATINWGDGSLLDTGTIKLDGIDLFHVGGTHTYAAAGVFTITVTVQVIGGGRFTNDPSTVKVDDAPITYTPPAQPVTIDKSGKAIAVNQAFTAGLGSVMDSDPESNPADLSATIDWGDQTGLAAGTVTPNNTPGQSYSVTGKHTYTTNNKTYVVTVTVIDSEGATATNTLLITVGKPKPAENPIAKNGIAQGKGSFIIAGQVLDNVLAVFTTDAPNAIAGDFSATVEWGDDSIAGVSPDTAPGIIVQGANDPSTNLPLFFVSGSHIYDRAGTYTFTVSMSVNGGSTASVSATATVSAAPLISQSAPISGVQGEPLPAGTVVATFTDTSPVPNMASYLAGTTATINWGDGESSMGTVTPQGTSPTGTTFVVTGEHTYANQNDILMSFQASVAISTGDGSGTEVADFVLLTVPVLTDPPLAVKAVAGAPFNVPVATIHTTLKHATASSFNSRIAWGDGQSSAGTLQSEGGGNFLVFGAHTYAQAGSFPIQLSFTDNHGNNVTDGSTATVTNAPVVAVGLPFSATPGKAFAGPVAAFADVNTLLGPGNFAAVINWGDGTTSGATVTVASSSSSGNIYLVNGAHKYKVKGTFRVTITILEPGVGQTTTTATATVGKTVTIPKPPPTPAHPGPKAKAPPPAHPAPKAKAFHPQGPLPHTKR